MAVSVQLITLCIILIVPDLYGHTTTLQPKGNDTINIAFFLHISNHGEGRRYGGAFFKALDEVNSEYDNLNFTYTFGDPMGQSWVALKHIADLYCDKSTSALIGPDGYCASAALAAKAFDLPYIAYTCHDALPEDQYGVYTFVSTEPSTYKVSKFIISVFDQFKWNTFTIISSHELKWRDTARGLEDLAILNNIRVNNITYSSEIDFFHPLATKNNRFDDVLKDTLQKTRIYVFLGDYQALIEFAREMYDKLGEKRKDYVLIGVDDRQPVTNHDEYFMHNPLELNKVTPTKEYLDPFRNVLILTLRPTTNKNWTSFLESIHERNKLHPIYYPIPPPFLKEKIPDIPIKVAYLYDAVKIYARALNETLASGGDITNASQVISKLRGRSYISIQGFSVYIDKHGQNEGNYSLMGIKLENGQAVSQMIAVADFARSTNNSIPMMLPSSINEISWLSGGPPPSQPECGFQGEKCNTNWELVVIGSVLAAAVIVLLAFGLVILRVSKYYRYEKKLASLLWKIDKEDLRFVDSVRDFYSPARQRKKVYSPWKFLLSGDNESDKRSSMKAKQSNTHVGSYRGTIVFIKQVTRRNLDVNREMKKQLQLRKELSHDNINRFIGACIELPEVYIVTQYCQRGSLQDILANEDSTLDDMFVSSLVADLIKGMVFIHDSNIISHGNLRSSNCLVDSRWVLQISDFGLPSVFNQPANAKDDNYYDKLLVKAPEILRNPQHHHPRGTQKADVYAFAFIIYEMYVRKGPWGDINMDPPEIVRQLKMGSKLIPFRPNTHQMTCESYITNCIQDCWTEDPEMRPDFKTVRNRLKPMHQGLKANIFDNMIAMMEKYANNLEALVAERTEQLSVEKKMTENLLLRMLPRPVAEQLKRGNPVVPEQYECVSIYFSDIVGFTALSAASTPMEVIDMLNDLYSLFDSIIEHYDVYKVETIGDAYVVVSGLPIRNKDNHAGEIASMSLNLLAGLKTFRLRHQPDSSVRIRIGIHSGPCCAGVVGHKMPRYCLFGDTVNTASRMESTGEAMKIHCSQELKTILDKLGGYYLEERGYIAMKGKGEKLTYFLVGEDKSHRIRRISVDQLSNDRPISDKMPEIVEIISPNNVLYKNGDVRKNASSLKGIESKDSEVKSDSNNINSNSKDFPSREIVRRHTMNCPSFPSRDSSPCDSQCSECEQIAFTIIDDPNERKCLLKTNPAKKCQKLKKHNSEIARPPPTYEETNNKNGALPESLV
ncbi:hypothetical protein LOTGIDRAFT_236119 [Lottia gigantea]|uniref:Guanylate cyclase n=1 Tax=Lottia gigantea TaxID=225164 RepID=V3ZKF5_LOTGI|nr:hypothetical protein LOTGIDRAFT_236119 [Lottia gigantea]ESO84762.1 hypothetical protein LOTGIDRAFT_236119 [Lottia gigantea]